LQSENSIGSDPLEPGQVWAISPGGMDEHPGLYRIEVNEGPGDPGLRLSTNLFLQHLKRALRFQDGNFKDPFAARYVSDGTIKMFTYLLLLNDPKQHALLCIEEPENQLYPLLLQELAEEFRQYSMTGGQVFISTHSPDFLNAVELNELYCLIKNDGYTKIYRAQDNELVASLFRGGDLLGYLWNQGLLTEGWGI
jgi:predicted ATPase